MNIQTHEELKALQTARDVGRVPQEIDLMSHVGGADVLGEASCREAQQTAEPWREATRNPLCKGEAVLALAQLNDLFAKNGKPEIAPL